MKLKYIAMLFVSTGLLTAAAAVPAQQDTFKAAPGRGADAQIRKAARPAPDGYSSDTVESASFQVGTPRPGIASDDDLPNTLNRSHGTTALISRRTSSAATWR